MLRQVCRGAVVIFFCACQFRGALILGGGPGDDAELRSISLRSILTCRLRRGLRWRNTAVSGGGRAAAAAEGADLARRWT